MTGYRLLLALALASVATGCEVAYKTGIIRNDELSYAQQIIADTKINHGDMTIVGSVDHADTTYKPGEAIVLSVKVSKNAHVAILRVLPNGDTTILFPNKAYPQTAVAPGTVLRVPTPGDPVTITAPDAEGVVLFEYIASTAGDSWLFTRPPDKGSDFADLGVTTRAIAKDIVDSLKIGKGSETAAIYVTVRVSGGGWF